MDESWDDLPEAMLTPRWRHLFTVRLQVAPALPIGTTPVGSRRVAVVRSGVFGGGIEGLSGTVHPGGNDWLTERPDGSLHLDARIVLETGEGEPILMAYAGIRHASPEVMAKLAAGEDVPVEDYYFRTAPRFETASERLGWLNRIVCFGIGGRLADGVRYSVFEVC